jgi:hypothetical protein
MSISSLILHFIACAISIILLFLVLYGSISWSVEKWEKHQTNKEENECSDSGDG